MVPVRSSAKRSLYESQISRSAAQYRACVSRTSLRQPRRPRAPSRAATHGRNLRNALPAHVHVQHGHPCAQACQRPGSAAHFWPSSLRTSTPGGSFRTATGLPTTTRMGPCRSTTSGHPWDHCRRHAVARQANVRIRTVKASESRAPLHTPLGHQAARANGT